MKSTTAGTRKKTRKKLTKRDLNFFTRYYNVFEVNETCVIDYNPRCHKGLGHPRFQGSHRLVKKQIKHALIVKIKDQNKTKELALNIQHVKKL
jgi:ribosomal protein L21E